MRTRQLASIVAIAEQQSFAAAAQKMNMTVPAITKSMQNLESDIGVPLLDKSGYRVKLTKAGESYVQFARSILSDLAEAKRRVHEIHHSDTLRLNVFAGPAIIRELIPVANCAFMDIRNDVLVSVHDTVMRANDVTLFQDVRVGDLDLALTPIPQDFNMEGLIWEPLLRMHLQIVVHNSHPLLNKKPLSFSDLCEFAWVVPSNLGQPYDEVQKIFHEFGNKTPKDVSFAPVLAREAQLKMLSLKPFVGILPFNEHIHKLDTKEFSVLDIDIDKFGWTLFTVRRKTNVANPIIDEYIDTLKTVLEEGKCL